MIKYFISLNNKKSGPFSLDELKKMNLTDEYLVWQNGFDDWKNIIEVDELKDFYVKLPPPLPNKTNGLFNNVWNKYENEFSLILFLFILFLVFLLVYTGVFLSDSSLIENDKGLGVYKIGSNDPDELRIQYIFISIIAAALLSFISFLFFQFFSNILFAKNPIFYNKEINLSDKIKFGLFLFIIISILILNYLGFFLTDSLIIENDKKYGIYSVGGKNPMELRFNYFIICIVLSSIFSALIIGVYYIFSKAFVSKND